jgi:hypothetical protein
MTSPPLLGTADVLLVEDAPPGDVLLTREAFVDRSFVDDPTRR